MLGAVGPRVAPTWGVAEYVTVTDCVGRARSANWVPVQVNVCTAPAVATVGSAAVPVTGDPVAGVMVVEPGT